MIIISVLLSTCYAQSDACVDYCDYTSVQAPDFDDMTEASRVILGPDYEDFIADTTAKFYLQSKICETSHGCNFVCSDTAACYQAKFECVSGTGCNLKCDETFSCGRLDFQASDNQQQIHIECGKDSCQEMQVFISDVQSAHIHCKQTDACTDMIIHFTNTPDTSVTCYEQDACTNLEIISDGYTHTTLHMYAYSSNIIFENQYGFNSNIITCDLHTKVIEYTYGDNNLDSLIRTQYGSPTAKLPCEDIVVKCRNDDGIGFCDMTYIMKSAWVFNALPSQIGSKFEGSTCVNIALYDVTSLKCQGSGPAAV